MTQCPATATIEPGGGLVRCTLLVDGHTTHEVVLTWQDGEGLRAEWPEAYDPDESFDVEVETAKEDPHAILASMFAATDHNADAFYRVRIFAHDNRKYGTDVQSLDADTVAEVRRVFALIDPDAAIQWVRPTDWPPRGWARLDGPVEAPPAVCGVAVPLAWINDTGEGGESCTRPPHPESAYHDNGSIAWR